MLQLNYNTLHSIISYVTYWRVQHITLTYNSQSVSTYLCSRLIFQSLYPIRLFRAFSWPSRLTSPDKQSPFTEKQIIITDCQRREFNASMHIQYNTTVSDIELLPKFRSTHKPYDRTSTSEQLLEVLLKAAMRILHTATSQAL